MVVVAVSLALQPKNVFLICEAKFSATSVAFNYYVVPVLVNVYVILYFYL